MTRIYIKNDPIPFELESKLSSHIVINGYYKKLNDKHIDLIKQYLKNVKPDLDIDTIFSMRSSYMSMKIMNNHRKLVKNLNEYVNLYKNKMTISEMSKKFDLSPMALLKNIYLKMNYSKDKIKQMFYSPKNIKQFDLEQIEYAKNYDIFNKIDQSEQIKNSEDYEKFIENYLITNNVKFKTQKMLTEEQIKLYGKPINTPDFLILSDLFINDKKINWIDAKNFYGANTFLINKKIKKQVSKYINQYGFGCIMFSLNFSEKLKFNDVLLINFPK